MDSDFFAENLLEVDYSDAGALIREALSVDGTTMTWDVAYQYDGVGNRTRRTLDTVQTDFTYGGGNREATVSGGAAPLTYDFKGNVIARQPLAGGDTYHYEYDEFDRLIECNGSGAVNFPTTRYNYDSTGRLLARQGNVGEEDESVTFFYWVGLNCLAVERPTDEMVESIDTVTWWPDREVEDAPERNGWAVYDAQGGESMAYVEDGSPDARGTVLHLTATGGTAPFNGQFIIGDNYSDVANPNDLPFDPEWMDFRLGVRVRNASSQNDTRFRLTALAETDTGSRVLMTFISGDGVDVSDGACRYFYMGTHLNDDAWHELDLPLDDLLTSLTGETLSAVTGLVVSASDLYLDGFHPETGAMIASYQLIPGAAIGGVLACEYPTAVAPPGGPIVMPAWTEYYYHYNDLGTVVGVTDIYGETVTVGVPDFFGNYRFTVGERATALIPDSSGTYHTIYVDQMGLTGKFHDPDTGLYYFGARWYDAERGRWMSEEPLGVDGPNLYLFCDGVPVTYCDPDGRWLHVVGALAGGFVVDTVIARIQGKSWGDAAKAGLWGALETGALAAGGPLLLGAAKALKAKKVLKLARVGEYMLKHDAVTSAVGRYSVAGVIGGFSGRAPCQTFNRKGALGKIVATGFGDGITASAAALAAGRGKVTEKTVEYWAGFDFGLVYSDADQFIDGL